MNRAPMRYNWRIEVREKNFTPINVQPPPPASQVQLSIEPAFVSIIEWWGNLEMLETYNEGLEVNPFIGNPRRGI